STARPLHVHVATGVGQTHSLQDIVDLGLQHHPDGSDAAAVRGGTTLLLNRMADAVQVKRLQLGRVDAVAYRNLSRWPGEDVPSARPTSAGDDPRAPQPQQDLLDVIRWKS